MKSRAIRVKVDVCDELDRRYPGLSPHQAIRKLLKMPAKEYRKRKIRTRWGRVRHYLLKALFELFK